MREGFWILVWIGLAIGAVLAYNGLLWTTGHEWYISCWQYRVEDKKPGDTQAPDPQTDKMWKSCEPIALNAFFEGGMLFSGLPENDEDKDGFALRYACPSTWFDLPSVGFYSLALDAVQESDGDNILDRFIPAEMMLKRVFKKKWPKCEAERKRQGYSTIMETSPGNYGWSAPCEKCR